MTRHDMSDVIVLLPGIMGSELARGGTTLWGFKAGTIGSALFSRGDKISKALMLHDDSPDPDVNADDITATRLMPDIHLMPGVWKIDGYSKIAFAIRRDFAVTDGLNLFEFPYDWRRDNRVNAKRLARAAHGWLARYRASTNPDAKLILVAHSMGGLVSRYFLEVLDGWKDARALITFGTPHRGSLNAVDGLANGVRKGPFGFVDLSALTRSLTSMYQLLPTYECFDNGDGLLRRIAESPGIPNIDVARALDALRFHEEIRDAVTVHESQADYLASAYRLQPIVGIGQDTNQSAVQTDAGAEMLTTHKGRALKGDGTVPRPSATPLDASRQGRETFAATQHGSLQNDDGMLLQLMGLITGLTLDLDEFRDAGERALSLEVEDLVTDDEPLIIRVRMQGAKPGVVPTASIETPGGATIGVRLTEQREGWFVGEAPPMVEGTYRVRASAAQLPTAEDSFVVASLAPE